MWKLWAKLFGWRYALVNERYTNNYFIQRVRGTGDIAYVDGVSGYYLLVTLKYIPLNFKEEDL